ncbi:hypothetical protein EJB05_22334, partial [Eragrostis curvula]
MRCEFSATMHEDGDVSFDGQVVAKKDTFRHLGSMLPKDGDIDEDLDIEFQPAGRRFVRRCYTVLNVGLQKKTRPKAECSRDAHTRRDRSRNEGIHDKVRVTPIEEKLVQTSLRWFRHVQRRPSDAQVHSCVTKVNDSRLEKKILGLSLRIGEDIKRHCCLGQTWIGMREIWRRAI